MWHSETPFSPNVQIGEAPVITASSITLPAGTGLYLACESFRISWREPGAAPAAAGLPAQLGGGYLVLWATVVSLLFREDECLFGVRFARYDPQQS